MMLVYIEDIQQNMSLSTGDVSTFAMLKLPTGEIISVPLSQEQVEKVMAASLGLQQQDNPEKEDSDQEEQTPDIQIQPEQDQAPIEVVRWEELPPTVLSDDMKSILREVGAAEEIPMSDFVSLVDRISEKMMQRAEANSKPSKKKSSVGQVIFPRAPVSRTVPKDDHGYPIVPGLDRDSGEIPIAADEDGVGML